MIHCVKEIFDFEILVQILILTFAHDLSICADPVCSPRCGLTNQGPVMTAQALCLEMVHFATKLTVAKRRILEDPDLYPEPKDGTTAELNRAQQRNRRRKVN